TVMLSYCSANAVKRIANVIVMDENTVEKGRLIVLPRFPSETGVPDAKDLFSTTMCRLLACTLTHCNGLTNTFDKLGAPLRTVHREWSKVESIPDLPVTNLSQFLATLLEGEWFVQTAGTVYLLRHLNVEGDSYLHAWELVPVNEQDPEHEPLEPADLPKPSKKKDKTKDKNKLKSKSKVLTEAACKAVENYYKESIEPLLLTDSRTQFLATLNRQLNAEINRINTRTDNSAIPNVTVQFFGSSVNNLGLKTADADLTIVPLHHLEGEETHIFQNMNRLAKVLLKNGYSSVQPISRARVPIV
ncbi:hypothetical protein HDU91_004496, partial [Kappamyces sp. JEL0680]